LRLSFSDCSVLFHATQQDAIILSGDKLLREIAQSLSLQVRGTLWILNELVEQGLLETAEAIQSLELLMKINTRLPLQDCQKLIAKWGKSVLSP